MNTTEFPNATEPQAVGIPLDIPVGRLVNEAKKG